MNEREKGSKFPVPKFSISLCISVACFYVTIKFNNLIKKKIIIFFVRKKKKLHVYLKTNMIQSNKRDIEKARKIETKYFYP